MDLRLRFEFEGVDATGFTIFDPPTIPVQGETVDFNWEDFVTNEKELERLSDFCDNSDFKADILARRYTKDYVEVLIVLCTPEVYDHWAAQRGKRSE